jgi:hypothetical protein
LKRKIKKDADSGDDTTANENKLADAEKQYDAAKKALDEYNANIASQNPQKASAAKKDDAVADASSQSTGTDNQALKGNPGKKRSWGLRSRGPQAQAQPVR